MHKRTALDELSDLLDDLPMTGIQRHWADEYLRDLGDDLDILPRLEQETEDLRDRVMELEDEVYG